MFSYNCVLFLLIVHLFVFLVVRIIIHATQMVLYPLDFLLGRSLTYIMEDCSVKNPQSQAGFLSLLTFSWMTEILKFGAKQPLGEKDLFTIESSYQSEKLVNDLESEWLAEERASEQNRTRPRLWRAMMRTISHREFITLAIHRLLVSLTFNGTPLMVYFFLRRIAEDSEKSYVAALPFVLCFALVPTVRSICMSQWVFKSQMVAIRLKVAMVGFVYKRVGLKFLPVHALPTPTYKLLLI